MTPGKPEPRRAYPSADRVSLNQRALSFVFRLYKAIFSPVLHAISPSRCIYLPTCSEYAYTAISRFGLVRGGWLALRRLTHCHPWAEGGLDPVPDCASLIDCRISRLASSGPNHKGADHLP